MKIPVQENDALLPNGGGMLILERVIEQMKFFLAARERDVDEILVHEIKSALYAAIERTGIELNRLQTIQRLLRELFGIVSIAKDLREYERQAGLQMLADLCANCRANAGGDAKKRFPAANPPPAGKPGYSG